MHKFPRPHTYKMFALQVVLLYLSSLTSSTLPLFFNLNISFRSCGAESMSPLACLSPSPSLSLFNLRSLSLSLSLSLKLIHPFAELEAQHCLPVSSGGSDGKIHAERVRDNSQLYQSRLRLSIKT